MKKVITIVFVILIVGVSSLLLFLKFGLPNVGEPEDIQIEITQERIERGKYLAHHVALCIDCHSTRDYSLFSAPLVPGTIGKGGEEFNENMGFPGNYVSKNITPTHLGDWTDGEILRAITTGVNKDGKALFPIMPYNSYGKMAREDLYSIIAYIRTLDPMDNVPKESHSNFPINFIINTMPTKANFAEQIPPKANKVEYGKYLTTVAACNDCHTNQVEGEVVGEQFAGGFEFKLMDGSIVRSVNITPHATGIKEWTEEVFILKFKEYADSSFVPEKVEEGEFQTVMPWMMYAGMEEEDLAAIYAYLRSLEPQDNAVERFTSN